MSTILQFKRNQGLRTWLFDRSFVNASVLLLAAALQPGCGKVISSSQSLRIGVVQMALEASFAENRDKIIQFVKKAKSQGCRLAVFPEADLDGTS